MMGKATILVVDDEQSYLDVIADALSSKDFRVLQAINGQMGYDVARRFQPDVIITDWEMPEMDGIQTIRKLKKNEDTKEIPVIMATGIMLNSEYLNEALNSGAVDYIRKPIDPVELTARINSTLRLSRSVQKIKQQKDELRDLVLTKEKIFSIIAHDLRNPIGNFKNLLGLLSAEDSYLQKEDLGRLLRMLQKSANATSDLLENLLAWAQKQSGKMSFDPETVVINELVDRCLALFDSTLRSKNIEITYDPQKSISTFCDPNMISTVIRNLLNNAIKFSNENGSILIAISQDNNNTLVNIKDKGVGIAEEIINKLFSHNDMQSTKGTKGEKGSGLGLVICKDFIDRHQGNIWVNSKKGEGTEFIFSIPTFN